MTFAGSKSGSVHGPVCIGSWADVGLGAYRMSLVFVSIFLLK